MSYLRTMQRIKNELKELKKDDYTCCTAGPVDGDLLHWKAVFKGPEDSPYAHGTFVVSIRFPLGYPDKPPKVKFRTKVFHPNINRDNGDVKIVMLKELWTPALTISTVLLSIYSLLVYPNLEDPMHLQILLMYKNERQVFEETARSWTQKYAMGTKESNILPQDHMKLIQCFTTQLDLG